MNRPRILITDDTPASMALLGDILEPKGYEVLTASSGKEALQLAAKALPDLILLDVMMPGHDGFSVCRMLKLEDATKDLPVIFITSRNETESLVNGFRVGAVDYIVKPFRPEEVITRVDTHLKISLLARELLQRNTELENEIGRRRDAEKAKERADHRLSAMTKREAKQWGLEHFIGASPHLKRVLDDIRRLQLFGKTSVLITGESGTGKELVARAIHHHSPRADGPFIPVNCVAIPADLAESMFFGHVKGAFTGATSDRKGWFELADGGTLFLDEIGDMPATLQAKLLRVLEDGVIYPVGSTQAHHVDVRVLSATNADLEEKTTTGGFRQDLYYRLARFSVHTPPLRERPDDLPALATHFLTLFATEMGLPVPALKPATMALIKAHPFPGNVRELKNVMERALILSGGADIEPAHAQLIAGRPAAKSSSAELPLNLQEAEHSVIQRALEETGGNVAEAARLLGVNRSRIYRRFPELAK